MSDVTKMGNHTVPDKHDRLQFALLIELLEVQGKGDPCARALLYGIQRYLTVEGYGDLVDYCVKKEDARVAGRVLTEIPTPNETLKWLDALRSGKRIERLDAWDDGRPLTRIEEVFREQAHTPHEHVIVDGAGEQHHKLDTDSQVFFYEQEFYVLSNFSAFEIYWRGFKFHTSEAAYHFEKFPDNPQIQNAVINAGSAHEAYKVAERNKASRRQDWDEVKFDIMLDILRAKTEQHEYVRRKLLQTGTRELVEDSWRDDFWGWGPDRKGQNWLGKLWMQIRAELHNKQTYAEPGSISGERNAPTGEHRVCPYCHWNLPQPVVSGEGGERPQECQARKAGTAGGNYPQDCNWPFCGCDEKASKIVEALFESGWKSPNEVAILAEQLRRAELEIEALHKEIEAAPSQSASSPCCPECRSKVIFNTIRHGAFALMICKGECGKTFECNVAEDFAKFFGNGERHEPSCDRPGKGQTLDAARRDINKLTPIEAYLIGLDDARAQIAFSRRGGSPARSASEYPTPISEDCLNALDCLLKENQYQTVAKATLKTVIDVIRPRLKELERRAVPARSGEARDYIREREGFWLVQCSDPQDIAEVWWEVHYAKTVRDQSATDEEVALWHCVKDLLAALGSLPSPAPEPEMATDEGIPTNIVTVDNYQELCAELYQAIGVLFADGLVPRLMMDKLSAGADGSPLPKECLLPFTEWFDKNVRPSLPSSGPRPEEKR